MICKVLPLDEKIYNCEHNDRLKWRQIVRKHHPKIIHFKRNTYRNKDFVAEIFWLAGIKKSFPFVAYCKTTFKGIKKKYLFLKKRLFKKRELADLRRILRKVMSLPIDSLKFRSTKYIYVMGCSRSGVTLMRELIGAGFNDIYSPHRELSLGSFLKLRHSTNNILVSSRNYDTSLNLEMEDVKKYHNLTIVWMLRNPLDVLVSTHVPGKQYSYKGGPDGAFYTSPERVIQSMELYNQLKNINKVITIKYEDLVGESSVVQNEIVDKCKLKIKTQFNDCHKSFAENPQTINAIHSTRPLDTKGINRWKSCDKNIEYIKNILSKYPQLIALCEDMGYKIEKL